MFLQCLVLNLLTCASMTPISNSSVVFKTRVQLYNYVITNYYEALICVRVGPTKFTFVVNKALCYKQEGRGFDNL
jgi:hypothetical protein